MMMTILEEGLPYTVRAVDRFALSLFGCMQPVWLLLLILLFGLMRQLAWSSTAACAHTVCDVEEGREQREPTGSLEPSCQHEGILEPVDLHQIPAVHLLSG